MVVVVGKTQVPLVIAPSIAIPIQYQFVLLPLIFGLSLASRLIADGTTTAATIADNGADSE